MLTPTRHDKQTTTNSFNLRSGGFTLVELLIVVAIITILSIVSTYAWQEVTYRAKVTRVVGDFRKIEAAWQLWRTDTHAPFPVESTTGFIAANPAATTYCDNDVLMHSTSIYNDPTDPNNLPGYQGPYLNQVLFDPTDQDREYLYDNDSDTYNPITGANLSGGANIVLASCKSANPFYWNMRNKIDKAIDGTDGDMGGGTGLTQGKFRATQDATSYDMYYLLEATP